MLARTGPRSLCKCLRAVSCAGLGFGVSPHLWNIRAMRTATRPQGTARILDLQLSYRHKPSRLPDETPSVLLSPYTLLPIDLQFRALPRSGARLTVVTLKYALHREPSSSHCYCFSSEETPA
jgi:hypothetical protein